MDSLGESSNFLKFVRCSHLCKQHVQFKPSGPGSRFFMEFLDEIKIFKEIPSSNHYNQSIESWELTLSSTMVLVFYLLDLHSKIFNSINEVQP
jgi:hypothetical protein